MSNPEWYYSEEGSQKGPITIEALRKLIETGDVSVECLAFQAGKPDWSRAEDLDELKASIEIGRAVPRKPKPRVSPPPPTPAPIVRQNKPTPTSPPQPGVVMQAPTKPPVVKLGKAAPPKPAGPGPKITPPVQPVGPRPVPPVVPTVRPPPVPPVIPTVRPPLTPLPTTPPVVVPLTIPPGPTPVPHNDSGGSGTFFRNFLLCVLAAAIAAVIYVNNRQPIPKPSSQTVDAQPTPPTTTPPAPAPRPTDRVTVPDDYPTVTAALAAGTVGQVIQIRSGTYYESIVLQDARTLQAVGSGVVIKATAGQPALAVNGASAVVIEGLEFEGNKSETVAFLDKAKVILRSCLFHGGIKGGIIANGTNIEMSRGKVYDNGKTGISLNEGSAQIEEVRVSGNGGFGMTLVSVQGAQIIGNETVQNGDDGMYIQRSGGLRLFRNTSADNKGAGIYFGAGVNATVERNVLRNNEKYGFYASGATGLNDVLRKNTFSANSQGDIGGSGVASQTAVPSPAAPAPAAAAPAPAPVAPALVQPAQPIQLYSPSSQTLAEQTVRDLIRSGNSASPAPRWNFYAPNAFYYGETLTLAEIERRYLLQESQFPYRSLQLKGIRSTDLPNDAFNVLAIVDVAMGTSRTSAPTTAKNFYFRMERDRSGGGSYKVTRLSDSTISGWKMANFKARISSKDLRQSNGTSFESLSWTSNEDLVLEIILQDRYNYETGQNRDSEDTAEDYFTPGQRKTENVKKIINKRREEWSSKAMKLRYEGDLPALLRGGAMVEVFVFENEGVVVRINP